MKISFFHYVSCSTYLNSVAKLHLKNIPYFSLFGDIISDQAGVLVVLYLSTKTGEYHSKMSMFEQYVPFLETSIRLIV